MIDETNTPPPVELDDNGERELLIAEARRDLLFYTSVCDPSYVIDPVHELIAQKLMAVSRGEIKRLIITQPPRTGKTRCVCIEWPTWEFGEHPKEEFVVISYNNTMPLDSSYKARQRMADPNYQKIFKTRMAMNRQGVEEWFTEQGGRYQAVGVGGTITGRGASRLICDDLTKDFEEAHSLNRLEYIWNWFWSTAYTRLSPDGAVVIIMTRWSTEDIVGKLTDPKQMAKLDIPGVDMSREKFEVINLPALALEGEPDPLGRKPGESVSPGRWPREKFEIVKASTLSYIWSAMYEGKPVIMGGNYIPVAQIVIVEPSEVPPDLRWCRGWDLATEEDEQNDETAGCAAAYGPDGTLYIKDMIHMRMKWPEARDLIKTVGVAERIPIGIEAVGGFKTAYQNLVEVLPPHILCSEIGVTKDKLTRALPWIALVAKKKFALVRGPWNMDFIVQAERFSGKNSDDDDLVDAISISYGMLFGGLTPPRPVNIDDRLRRAQEMRRKRSLDG